METNDNRITQENNPSLWQQLMNVRSETTRDVGGAPGWVVVGNVTYKCIQLLNGSIAFIPKSTESLYESTSF
jgi:hypothetical protein